jgi:hypothetical protein
VPRRADYVQSGVAFRAANISWSAGATQVDSHEDLPCDARTPRQAYNTPISYRFAWPLPKR